MIRALLASVLCGGLLASGVARAEDPELQALAHAVVGADQGVFAQAEDGSVLVEQHADRAVHPASVMKIATTLALLRVLGPEHRFQTRVLASGPVHDGAIHGNLVVESEGDPVLVDENAFLLLLKLRALGVQRVDGTLQVQGPLFFNWEPDPTGARLRRALAGGGGGAAWSAVQRERAEARDIAAAECALRFGARSAANGSSARHTLLVHVSPPLRRVAKELNCYSNNIFHELSKRVGGPAAVQRIVAESVPPEVRAAIRIENAAGAGTESRLSPRAAAAIIRALSAELRQHGLSLADVLPVAGIDDGTLHTRLRDEATQGAVVAKTGTYGSLGACSLAGVIRTRTYGDVTFAVLNRGLSVPEGRRRQDAFVRGLAQKAGAMPWEYRRSGVPAFVEARLDVASAP
jgi:D-alanyl-D-alanine carboxypeptidase/D-alanyl-D-alanine-endopeptidase (penicillin-binding protein 4)